MTAPRPSARSSRLARALVAIAFAAPLSGCVLVKPSQRAYLATPEMDPSTGAEEHTFHSHVEAAREGAFGGHGTQGGGCGCG